ncbi:MAG: sodium-potassium/proton antiporter ChaA [Candidatus Lightella neohaematopini]|nr:sodium-potassium/proton antiporter ChaA [Candidatus Lightella neohaematopini]MCV2529011.1 sodium-potassium/proton antiporter ChaA [Candidatus Lightella neohaematopini]
MNVNNKLYCVITSIVTLIVLYICNYYYSIIVLVISNLVTVLSIIINTFNTVRHADVLAHRFGEPFGSLILTLSVVILEASLISALMITNSNNHNLSTLMRDTLYSVIMIVTNGLVGLSLLLGGRKFDTQSLNLAGIKQYLMAIILLSIIVLIFPSTLPNGNFNTIQTIIIGTLCIIMYGVFLLIQTHTHQSWFIYEHEDVDNYIQSIHTSLWHSFWLIIHLLFVIITVKVNASSLNKLLIVINAPKQIAGFLIALLTLSPEGLGAIRAVLNNQAQRAMNLLFGSVLATISLTVPTVIVLSFITKQQIFFSLTLPQCIALLTTLVVCQVSLSTGRTNILNGATHLTLFIIYLITILLY